MTDKTPVNEPIQMHTHLLRKKQLQAGMYMALQQAHGNVFGQVYTHYKGSTYFTLGVAIDTVTNKAVITYMNEVGTLFTRPQKEFFGYVDEANTIQRFTLMQD